MELSSSCSLPGTPAISTGTERTDMGGLLSNTDPGQDNTKRRSSSRSIKRRRFDDEIVEYSLGLPGASSAIKSTIQNTGSRSRTHSSSTSVSGQLQHGLDVPSLNMIQTTTGVPSPPPHTVINIADTRRKHPVKHTTARNKKKGRQHSHVTTKDLGRWKPTDDLALIIGVQQTNDLRTVHVGTKFSCRFTVQELQQRWYALLYDEAVSRVAVAAMRGLHPDAVAAVQARALWSAAEERLLSEVPASSTPSLSVFEELLARSPETFHPARTARALQQHWTALRQHHLLPDQSVAPLPTDSTPSDFADAENALLDSEPSQEPGDEETEAGIALALRKNLSEIRQLENEIGRWHILVDSVTSYGPPEFDNQTLAVLRGRLVRYLMRSREITIGRSAKGHSVDVDLSLEGPSWKISRRQGTLRLRNTGEFYLSSEGKRPIFVDGKPMLAGNKVRLYNNSVVEISCLRFVFTVNMDLIRVIRNEAIRLGLPP